jgi:exopolyphosphatase/pppGpp-phosphohydrolase
LAQAYFDEAGETPDSLQGLAIARQEMSDFCALIEASTPAHLQSRYKFEDKRAALAPVSAFVLNQVFTHLKPQKIVVSLAGIRDGIVHDFLHPPGLSNA